MKKFLPNNKSSVVSRQLSDKHGFTLIELLVVITIIAVLATVGFIAYSGVSARGRDARRMEELRSIGNAMEKNYQPGVGYVVLSTGDFTNSAIPTDPWTTQNKCGDTGAKPCDYCAYTAGTAFGYPSVANCTATNRVSATQPAASNVGYVVCANLETAAGVAGVKYYCIKNAQ